MISFEPDAWYIRTINAAKELIGIGPHAIWLSDLGECPAGNDLAEAVLTWNYKAGKVMQDKDSAWTECVRKWYDKL